MNLIIERGEEGGFGACFDSDECTEWGAGPTPEAALADLLSTLCEEKYGGHNENGAFAGRAWWHSADESNVRGDGISQERADKGAKNAHIGGEHATYILTREGHLWSARRVENGVSSCGATEAEALASVKEAVELFDATVVELEERMTKKERIVALERRVKELEERMVEAQSPYPIWVWTPWVKPYEATCTDGTDHTIAAPPLTTGQMWCTSAWFPTDDAPVGNTSATIGPITETE